jgi:hypothetical protein
LEKLRSGTLVAKVGANDVAPVDATQNSRDDLAHHHQLQPFLLIRDSIHLTGGEERHDILRRLRHGAQHRCVQRSAVRLARVGCLDPRVAEEAVVARSQRL